MRGVLLIVLGALHHCRGLEPAAASCLRGVLEGCMCSYNDLWTIWMRYSKIFCMWHGSERR